MVLLQGWEVCIHKLSGHEPVGFGPGHTRGNHSGRSEQNKVGVLRGHTDIHCRIQHHLQYQLHCGGVPTQTARSLSLSLSPLTEVCCTCDILLWYHTDAQHCKFLFDLALYSIQHFWWIIAAANWSTSLNVMCIYEWLFFLVFNSLFHLSFSG